MPACLFPCSCPRKAQLPGSRPSRLIPSGCIRCCRERYCRHGGCQRKSPGPSRGRSLGHAQSLHRLPLSGWAPPRAIPFTLSSFCFSLICHFPTTTFTPLAPPNQGLRISSLLIGRWACLSHMCPAPPKPKDTSGSPWFYYTVAYSAASDSPSSMTCPTPGMCLWRV